MPIPKFPVINHQPEHTEHYITDNELDRTLASIEQQKTSREDVMPYLASIYYKLSCVTVQDGQHLTLKNDHGNIKYFIIGLSDHDHKVIQQEEKILLHISRLVDQYLATDQGNIGQENTIEEVTNIESITDLVNKLRPAFQTFSSVSDFPVLNIPEIELLSYLPKDAELDAIFTNIEENLHGDDLKKYLYDMHCALRSVSKNHESSVILINDNGNIKYSFKMTGCRSEFNNNEKKVASHISRLLNRYLVENGKSTLQVVHTRHDITNNLQGVFGTPPLEKFVVCLYTIFTVICFCTIILSPLGAYLCYKYIEKNICGHWPTIS